MNRLPQLTSWAALIAIAVSFPRAGTAQPADQSAVAANRLYRSAAGFQNNDQFDLAAEDWEKLLRRFPTDPLVDKATYHAGVCRLQLGDFVQASGHFEKLLARSPDFARAEEAYLNLGWCQYELGDKKPDMYTAASRTLKTLIDRFPAGKYLDQAIFYLGEAYYARGDRKQAIKWYERLVNAHRGSTLYCDALYALGVAHEEQDQFDEARKAYDAFGRRCAASELATEVRMRSAEVELQLGNVALAERQFAQVAAVDGFAAADHALFRQAFCVARQERFVEAARLYGQLVDRYPKSKHINDATLSAARGYYRGDKLAEAANWLHRALAREPNGPRAVEAAHWLARIHLDRNDSEAALAVADSGLAAARDVPFRVHLLLDRGDALRGRQPRAAAESYQRIAAKFPDHELAPRALYNAAFAWLELEEFAEARRLARIFAARYPDDELLPDTRQIAAESALQTQEYAPAERQFRQLIKEFPSHAMRNDWQIRLALTLHLQGKDQEAVALRQVVPRLREPGQRAEAHFVVGISQFALEQFESAANHFTQALAATPDWYRAEEALLYLSRAQQGAGRLDRAIASAEKFLRQYPDSSMRDRANYRLGEYQLAAGDLQRARRSYQRVLDESPDSAVAPPALFGIGWSELRSQNYQAAIDAFTRLLNLHPEHRLASDARLARGMAYRQSNRFREATADLRDFLKSSPEPAKRADALFERGLAEAAEEKYDEAIKTFQLLLADFPRYAEAASVLYELAWAFHEKGDSSRSTSAFQRLIERFPDHPSIAEAYLHIGEDHYAQRRYDLALVSFRQAREAAKEEDLAERGIHKLGWTHYRLEQFDKASQSFEKQLVDHPDGELAADARFMRAECLFRQRNYQAAWAGFVQAARDPPSSPAMRVLVFLHGGQAAAKLEQWAESRDFLERIPGDYPNSAYLAEALFERGRACQKLGDFGAAVADYERAESLSAGVTAARARFMIGEVQFAREEFDEAINSFRRVMYGFGGKDAETTVKPWQAMAAFEAGRCAEVKIQKSRLPDERAKQIANAIQFYRLLADAYPDHELAAQARQRLLALSKMPASGPNR